jgi:hypothetical protein
MAMKRSTFLVLTLTAAAVLVLAPAFGACTDLVSDEDATRADTSDAITSIVAAFATTVPADGGPTPTPAATAAAPSTPATTAGPSPSPWSEESPSGETDEVEDSGDGSEDATTLPGDIAPAIDPHPLVTAVEPGIIVEALWNRYEETDPRLVYGGSWSTLMGPECSAGAIRCCADPAAGVITIRFSGININVIGLKSDLSGSAYVTLDGGTPVTVSYLGSGLEYQQLIWSSGPIAAGEHVVTIQVKEGQINLDALDVLGQLL